MIAHQVLFVSNATAEDEGYYKCKTIDHTLKSESTNVFIKIHGKSLGKRFFYTFLNCPIIISFNQVRMCHTLISPILDFNQTWNNRPIRQSNGLYFTKRTPSRKSFGQKETVKTSYEIQLQNTLSKTN